MTWGEQYVGCIAECPAAVGYSILDDGNQRASVLGVLEGSGKAGGLMFNGHVDSEEKSSTDCLLYPYGQGTPI